MKSFFRKLNRSPRRTAGVAIVLAAVLVPASLFAWGPNRTTYTMEQPADHVTFNSITNNPNYGDERNFVTVKDPKTNQWVDNVTVEPGQEYTVRVLIHNDAAENLNLVAMNTTLHTAIGEKAITAHVSADNATPKTVYDDVFFNSPKNFNLAYIEGSATVYNNGYAKGGSGKPFSDAMVTKQGAKLGYKKEGDGKIPGCMKYINYVYFKVKPQFAKEPNFSVTKKVSHAGKNQFKDSIEAKSGDKIDYAIEFRNTGEVQLDDVVLKDQLPAHVSYVPGSSKLINSQNAAPGKQLSDNIVSQHGLNIGSHAPNSNSFVTFQAKVNKSIEDECGTSSLVNRVSAETNYGKKEDTADVIVKVICDEKPPVEKIKVCELESKKIIEINKEDFDNSKHSTNLADCKEKPVEKIEVCELSTKDIIKINKDDFDSSKHSTDLSDCEDKPVIETIEVCEVTTGKIITINKDLFDSSQHSTNLADCDTPVVETIEVCETATKNIVTINKNDFDASKHTTNLSDCETVVTPTELPQTGSTGASALAVIGAMTLSLGYVVAGRRLGNL